MSHIHQVLGLDELHQAEIAGPALLEAPIYSVHVHYGISYSRLTPTFGKIEEKNLVESHIFHVSHHLVTFWTNKLPVPDRIWRCFFLDIPKGVLTEAVRYKLGWISV